MYGVTIGALPKPLQLFPVSFTMDNKVPQRVPKITGGKEAKM